MSEEAIIKLLSQSPAALALLVVGFLARRWLEPLARELWAQWRQERQADRSHAEARTAAIKGQADATAQAARVNERLADALEHIGRHGLRLDATPQNGKPHNQRSPRDE